MNKTTRYLLLSTILIFFIFINGVEAIVNNSLEVNNSCVDCHKTLVPNGEEQERVVFKDIIINHTARNVSCSLDCHRENISKIATDNYHQWAGSSHANYYVTCDKCHGGNPDSNNKTNGHIGILNNTDPNSTIYFKNIPATCGKCHSDEFNNFENTMHYQRLQAESLAPSCITCHPPHTFNVPNSLDIIRLCGRCHNPTLLPSLASVPIDAKNALDKVNYFHDLVIDTRKYIVNAKSSGHDVKKAQEDLDNAISSMDIPSMWHGFNLQNFDQHIQSRIDSVEKVRNDIVSSNNTENVKAPNVPIIMVLGIFVLAFMLKKRYNNKGKKK